MKFYSFIKNLLLITSNTLFLNILPVNAQEFKNVILSGTFWEYENGTDLNHKITVYSSGRPVFETKPNNKVKINLNKNYEMLRFFSEGYNPLEFPIHFIGEFEKPSSCTISFKTDLSSKKTELFNYIIYTKPSDYDKSLTYELIHYLDGTFHCSQNITKNIEFNNGLVVESKEKFVHSSYNLRIKRDSIQVLQENIFKPKDGINFIDLNRYPNIESDRTSKKTGKLPIKEDSVFHVFLFEQGKFDLVSYNLTKLGSILNKLVENAEMRLYIKGFSDGTGDPDLNVILAEYRTKVIANYFKKNHIDKSRLMISWQTKEEIINLQKTDINLENLRKVEITEIK